MTHGHRTTRRRAYSPRVHLLNARQAPRPGLRDLAVGLGADASEDAAARTEASAHGVSRRADRWPFDPAGAGPSPESSTGGLFPPS